MNIRYSTPRRYAVTVQHDAGRARLIVTATSKRAAAEQIQKCEGYPRRAIVTITPIKDRPAAA